MSIREYWLKELVKAVVGVIEENGSAEAELAITLKMLTLSCSVKHESK